MSNFDSDGIPEQEGDERGELVWNEFDWERYLREQDEAVHRYLRFYESCRNQDDRIDAVAEKMGWGQEEDGESDVQPADDSEFDDDDVYTLHENPIYVATKAIGLGVRRSWESLATDNGKAPQPLAVAFLASIHRSEEQAILAIHALDFGDYAMAVSLFKRSLSALNGSLSLLNADATLRHAAIVAWREDGQARLFVLREIWLRVIAECRDELERPVDEEN